MLKRQWELRKDELIVIIVIMAVMTIGMSALVNILIAFVDDGEALVQISPVAGVIGIAIFLVIFVGFAFSPMFNLAVSCGETRKQFFVGYLLFSLFESILSVGIIILMSILEKAVLQVVVNDKVIVETASYVFQAKYITLGVLFVIALVMLCNAMTMRYGKTAFWIIWAVWMVCSIGSSKIISFIAHTEWIKDLLKKVLPATGTLVVGYLLVPVMLGIAWGYLRKQRVTW